MNHYTATTLVLLRAFTTSLMNFCSEVKSNRQLDLVLHNANTVKRQ